MKIKILIVIASYYNDIALNLSKNTQRYLNLQSIKNCKKIEVPGVFEIPVTISKRIKNFDGFIALGCVIRGETSHYEYVCSESARALMNLSLEGIAIGYGILTVENYNQALVRSKTIANKGFGKGKVAALACINQINLKIKYTDGS